MLRNIKSASVTINTTEEVSSATSLLTQAHEQVFLKSNHSATDVRPVINKQSPWCPLCHPNVGSSESNLVEDFHGTKKVWCSKSESPYYTHLWRLLYGKKREWSKRTKYCALFCCLLYPLRSGSLDERSCIFHTKGHNWNPQKTIRPLTLLCLHCRWNEGHI